ncbi:MAG TPA: choice-of-anchor Q domain-containing protein [Polyangia bacterium]|jgi:hypothetical protein
MLRAVVLFALAPLVGCSEPVADFCDLTHPCASAAKPRCDVATRTCMPADDGGQLDAGGADAAFDAMGDAAPPDAGCGSSAACVDPAAPICGAGGACRGCQGGAECAARAPATPVCHPDGRCVECRASADCAAKLDTPVCDLSTSTCTACAADAQCPYFCDSLTGRCATEPEIVFVDNMGPHCPTPLGGAGSAADPYCEIQKAVDSLGIRRYVHVRAGMYAPVLVLGASFRLRAEQGARVQGVGAGGAGVALQGGTVLIDGLQVLGGNVSLTAGASVTLRHVKVQGATNYYGLACDQSTLVTDAVAILSNSQGGLRLNGCTYTIVNSVIASNGSASSTFGGVWILTPGAGSSFVNNTVVGNTATANIEAGVRCSGAAPVTNSVVWWNSYRDASTTCAVTSSNLGQAVTGQGNISQSPSFKDRTGGDFHYDVGSAGIDTAASIGAPDHDFDGYPRPYGTAPDMGAFEWHP